MSSGTDELITTFHHLFGDPLGSSVPGNVGEGCNAAQVCRELMGLPEPLLYDDFAHWDGDASPLNVACILHHMAQREAAWALLQLRYDQILKREAHIAQRLHKGSALCDLAILAQKMGPP